MGSVRQLSGSGFLVSRPRNFPHNFTPTKLVMKTLRLTKLPRTRAVETPTCPVASSKGAERNYPWALTCPLCPALDGGEHDCSFVCMCEWRSWREEEVISSRAFQDIADFCVSLYRILPGPLPCVPGGWGREAFSLNICVIC